MDTIQSTTSETEGPLNYQGPMAADVVKMVSDFLVTPVKSDGGWADITDEDWKQLHEIFYSIIEAKFQRDADNDQTVEYAICNRKNGRMEVVRVPYQVRSDEDMERGLDAISVASDIIERLTRSMAYVMGEKRRANARKQKMQPVINFCASNGHIQAHDRIRDYVQGEGNNLFVGHYDAVWAPLGLTCSEIKAVISANLGKARLHDEVDILLLNAVNCMEGN